jgi:hypothetical protein
VKLLPQAMKLIEATFDLIEDVVSLRLDIFVAQLNEHLGNPGDGPHNLDGIIVDRTHGKPCHPSLLTAQTPPC